MTVGKKERGICELYQGDPERADWLVFGRLPEADRRGFLKGAGLAAIMAAVGAPVVFARNMPAGLIPAALAETTEAFLLEGKEGLHVLNDRPINAETPADLLDDEVTPNHRHFVRNNGFVPDKAKNMDASGWTLTIDGEVDTPLTLTLDDLKSNFEVVKLKLQLECGGNGRAAFNPPAKGNQWTVGAIGNANWTGVRFRDVMNAAGIKETAVYTGYYGTDVHLSGDPEKVVISRGAPIWKMMEPHNLIAFEMNGEPLPPLHGFPVRTVVPGWPGSVSGKWLKRIWVRDQVHDGPKMTGQSYRVPEYPVAPGADVPESQMKIIEAMPVKSIITSPATGVEARVGEPLALRGHAWCGDGPVEAMHVSFDFASTWIQASLASSMNPHAWQQWEATIEFPGPGYYEVWGRATDHRGRQQPMVIPGWNPRGYLNNAMQRISVRVA